MAYVVQRFLLFCFFVLFSEAADTLLQGEALADGETLISQNQIFELGFFTPSGENSSRARYLGIWYHGLPSMTVVWVANRNQPFSGAGGKLTFSADGNLVILSGAGDSIQITNSTSAASNSSLYLSHAGNLFLNSSSRNQVLWQSFDHPTDTFLPGMKLTLDLSTRESLLLRSWKSIGDPGEGNFSLGLDPRGSAQVYIWNGEKPRWRSGEWNRRIFIGISIRPLGLYGFNLYTEEGKMSLTFSEYNGSIFRFVIQPEGGLQVLQMVSGSKKWNTAFALPGNDCEIYNWCGDNALCVISAGGAAACECVTGFVPAAGGCVRRKELGCGLNGGERDGYAEVRGINLPDFSRWEKNSTDGESCAEACSGNCSCAAYAFVNQIGCLLWGTPLVDMHQLSAGGYDLYLKLAASELREASSSSPALSLLFLSLIFPSISLSRLYLSLSPLSSLQPSLHLSSLLFSYLSPSFSLSTLSSLSVLYPLSFSTPTSLSPSTL